MSINLKQLETFVCVADCGSFHQAASRLNTTQPNVSARISALEASLDTRVLDRDITPITLTPSGNELIVYARRVLRSMDEFLYAADKATLGDGVLRLGVTEMIVNSWLRDFLLEFRKRYPETIVELKVDLSTVLESDLENRAIDLAFQSGPFRRDTTGSEELGSFSTKWVAAPQIAATLPANVSLDDLEPFPIITHARVTKMYSELQAHIATREDLKLRLVPSNNLASCVQMAIDGFGVAPLLQPLVESKLASGELAVIDYDWQPQPLSFFARFDKLKAPSSVLKAAQIAKTISNHYAAKYVSD